MATSNTPLLPLSRGWAADASPLGIVALSREGRILYANPAMDALLGFDRGELTGHDAAEFHPIPELALSLARDRRTGDRIQGLELGLVSIGGRDVSVRVTATLLDEGPAGAAVVATVEDISTLRIRESSESQARTMSAVGRLAGGMAHHFNNLLASILGQVDLLGAVVGPDAEGRPELDSIAVAARRAKEIADLLLIVSGKEVGSRERVELGGWIYEAAGRFRPGLPGDVELVVRAEAGEHGVHMDRDRLSQVLAGLVSNAEEALPGGGTIALEVGRWRPEVSGDAHLFSPPPGPVPYVCITVADDGMGMNEETLSRALEPFFSTKRDREGAGLGLATIYGIVAQSGGHVAIESAPVIGTRVRILLPEFGSAAPPRESPSLMAEGWGRPAGVERRAPESPAAPPRAPAASFRPPETAAPPRPDETSTSPPEVDRDPVADGPDGVLVVDDEDTIREVMSKILRRAGFQVWCAVDGRDAQRVFQTERERIGMVVTDVMMPRMNGVELLEWLARESPGTATLMVSGFAGSPLVQQWVDHDPSSFLAKPFEAPDFLARVKARWRLSAARG